MANSSIADIGSVADRKVGMVGGVGGNASAATATFRTVETVADGSAKISTVVESRRTGTDNMVQRPREAVLFHRCRGHR
jgi:hypothetical protein